VTLASRPSSTSRPRPTTAARRLTRPRPSTLARAPTDARLSVGGLLLTSAGTRPPGSRRLQFTTIRLPFSKVSPMIQAPSVIASPRLLKSLPLTTVTRRTRRSSMKRLTASLARATTERRYRTLEMLQLPRDSIRLHHSDLTQPDPFCVQPFTDRSYLDKRRLLRERSIRFLGDFLVRYKCPRALRYSGRCNCRVRRSSAASHRDWSRCEAQPLMLILTRR
jgi:hypothetical protein